jgi:uncharacterized protein with PIN domain
MPHARRLYFAKDRDPKLALSALVAPDCHRQLKEQAFRNNETIGELLERLIESAPAAAWTKPKE